jgi:hypothetical protein
MASWTTATIGDSRGGTELVKPSLKRRSDARVVLGLAIAGMVVVGTCAVIESTGFLRANDYSQTVNSNLNALNDGERFKLRAATPFAWDAAFVFPPYTDPNRVDKRVGFRVDVAHESLIPPRQSLLLRDDICLLVFELKGQPVATIEVPTSINFSGASEAMPSNGYAASATFVRRNGWIYPAAPAGGPSS